MLADLIDAGRLFQALIVEDKNELAYDVVFALTDT